MDLFFYFFEWIILLGVGIWIYKKDKFRKLRNLFDLENTFHILLAWIVFGFLFKLDYTDRFGCLSYFEPILGFRNVIFSTISFSLIFFAFKTSNQKLKKALLSLELIYWGLKLITFKGGYAVGYGGGGDFFIVLYDSVSVFLRLLILSQIFEINRIKKGAIPILVILIMAIKISIFSIPLSFLYEEFQARKEAKKLRTEIIGNWEGEFQKLDYEDVILSKKSKLQIDSNFIYLNEIEGLEDKYFLDLDYSNSGKLIKRKDVYDNGLYLIVEKDKENSMVVTISDFAMTYKFDLKKNSAE